MKKSVAFMSGKTTFSPSMQQLIEQSVETMKLDIIQGLAFEKEPEVFKKMGIHENPSKLGKIVANRLRSLSADSKRNRPDYRKNLPLQMIYDGEIRKLTRKYNVDLVSQKSVHKQIDVARSFAYIARDLESDAKVRSLHENLFDSVLDARESRVDARRAIAAVLPAASLDPAVARIIADRVVGRVNWPDLFRPGGGSSNDDSGDGSDNGNDAPDIQLNRGLKFRLHQVKCVDETNPEWPGDDEIAAGGVAVNWDETTSQIPEFRVGNSFDDGESVYYNPPRILKTFSLNQVEYPADFLITMALAEKDNGGLSSFIQELWEAIKDEVQVIIVAVSAAAGAAIGAGIGGSVGTAIGGPLGTIIGAAAGAIVGALVGWLISALKDDIFQPQAAALRLPSHDSNFSGGSLSSQIMTLNFRDHGGHYRAYYSWQLTR